MSEQYDIHNNQPTTVSKAHQQRSCAVCKLPIIDEKAVPLSIGGGLEVLVHKGCLSELVEAMQPVTVTIPVPVAKPSTVTRKSTYAPYDQDRMAANIKREVYQLLLDEGMRQRR